MLGLHFCARAFSSCGERGTLFIAVHGPLTIAASLVVEHRPQMRRLSSWDSGAQLLRGMWDLPRPGLKPVSPALAGRFSTTAPPGKPGNLILMCLSIVFVRVFILLGAYWTSWSCVFINFINFEKILTIISSNSLFFFFTPHHLLFGLQLHIC